MVTWGDESVGGDSSAVQEHLCNVRKIQSGRVMFVAIACDDGDGDDRIITWPEITEIESD